MKSANSQELRVLFINRMLSMVRGGGETFDLEISRHLADLGCRVSYLSGLPLFGGARSPLDRTLEESKQTSHERSGELHLHSSTIRTPYWGWFPWDKVRGGWRLRWLDFRLFERKAAHWAAAHSGDFDVIQVCELPTFVNEWKRMGKTIPVVARFTAPDFHDPENGFKQADAVIASGATMAQVRKGSFPGCVDIPNGVDVSLFKPQPSSFRSMMSIEDDELVVIWVARFQKVKGHKLLVEAFSRLLKKRSRSRLVFAGSGPLEEEVKSQCRALGIEESVLFLGETAYSELPAIYAAADLQVVPSDYESFCFAALEAMATGLPVVTTHTDWVPHLIGYDAGKNSAPGGIVVPKRDPEAMAAALLEMALDSAARRAKGSWNRQRVEKDFGWTTSAGKLLDLYRTLTNNKESTTKNR